MKLSFASFLASVVVSGVAHARPSNALWDWDWDKPDYSSWKHDLETLQEQINDLTHDIDALTEENKNLEINLIMEQSKFGKYEVLATQRFEGVTNYLKDELEKCGCPTDSTWSAPTGAGCCSNDDKTCASWCNESKDFCESEHCTDMKWLDNGSLENSPDPAESSCVARWGTCTGDGASCCTGLSCETINEWYSQCLHDNDPVW